MAAFDLSSLVLQLAVIIGAAALFRWLATRAKEPAVLGEIVLGVILGPSLLAWLWPGGHATLFPADNRVVLEALAWIGLLLFMYLAGSEMQWRAAASRATLFVSLGGLVVPLALGTVLAMGAPHWFFDGDPGAANLLIVAAVMTVSALPVLARILQDLDLLDHPVGAIAMGAGTIDDIAGWALLALVIGAGGVGLTGHFGINVAVLLLVLAAALLLDRLVVPVLARRGPPNTPALFVWLLLAIFGSAILTDAAGLHAVIGPFVVGAIVSRHEELREYAQMRLRGLTMVFFLPLFFVMAGADIDLTLLDMPAGLVALLAIFAVACVAKILGAYIGGRIGGLGHSSSVVTGILMNARGAVGLATAKIAFDAGLISAQGFALLATMVALTTFIAPPLVQLYVRWTRRTGALVVEPAATPVPRT